MRLYPSEVPEFLYEPTLERFSVRAISKDVGEGLVALIPFEPGAIVFGFTGFLVTEITQFSLQLMDGLHIHDPYVMGKVLHSCDPNTSVDLSARIFVARRRILPGEVIMMDYEDTEDRLFKSFQCKCGATTCRGFITGRAQ